MNKWIFLLIILFTASLVKSQDGIFGKITKTRGGNVKFHMNSIKRIQEGITYTDFLELTITYCDSNYTSSGWELYVRALDPEFIAAMNSIPTIPLDKIKITSRMDDGTDIATDVALSQSDLLVGEGAPPSAPDKCIQDKVILSFTCSSLMGYSFDFYDNILSFDLKSKP